MTKLYFALLGLIIGLIVLTLASAVSGVSFSQLRGELMLGAQPALTVPQGGTGTSTIPKNYVLIGDTSNRITAVSTSSLGITGGGSGTPGGSDTQIQFNDGGSFGGDPNFTWNSASQQFTVSTDNLVVYPQGLDVHVENPAEPNAYGDLNFSMSDFFTKIRDPNARRTEWLGGGSEGLFFRWPKNGFIEFAHTGTSDTSPINLVIVANNPATDAAINATRTISTDGGTPTSGTFTITYLDYETSPIAWNADAATIETALEALTSIGAGNVSVTGGPLPSDVFIEYVGTLAGSDQANRYYFDNSGLSGGGYDSFENAIGKPTGIISAVGSLALSNNGLAYIKTGASNTAWTALCLTTTCTGGSGFSTTSADFWKTQNSFFSTTSANYWASFLNFGLATSSLARSGPITISTSASAVTVGFSGLATTTQPLSSQLLVSNGASGVFGVSTSSCTISSPLSGTLVCIGSGSISIQAASASQAGSMSAGDYTRLYSATTTAGTGLTYSGNAFNVNTSQNISTLSNLTSNGFVRTSGGTGALSIDTTTYAAFAYPFAQNATSSRLYINGGLFASSTIQFGNTGLAQFFWDSAAGRLGIGTTTPRWPLTISSSTRPQLGLTDGNNTDNWVFRDAGQNLYISTSSPLTFATSSQGSIFTLLGGSSLTSSGNMGLASTTPWGRLSIGNSITLGTSPAFVVGSASKAQFQVTSGGQTAVCGSLFGATGEMATSTAIIIDWAATCPTITLWISTSATTITFINATTTNMYGSRKLIEILNPNGTAGALTWTNTAFGSTAPTQTTTANTGDAYSCYVGFATSSTLVSPTYKVRCGQSIVGIQ